jgi:triacylglycerol esterase/lipase EstA (alpha/beta hydrolase family)
MKSHLLPAITLTLCALLTSCANFAKVKEKRPVLRPISTTLGAIGTIHQGLENSLKQSKRQPMVALAGYLAAADAASKQLALTPNDAVIREDYNFAVARILTIIQDSQLDPWTQPLTVPAKDGDFILTRKPDARKAWNPALYTFTPADQFDIGGSFIKEHNKKDGLGAPIVAFGKQANQDAKQDFNLPRTYYGVTALARFKGRTCEIGFEDPLATESVKLGGHTFPLAADFTVPIAVMLDNSNAEKMGLSRLINPEKYADTARITRLQPYDPNKTVILVVHGLNSSPATWTPIINSLRNNEEIRRNFQFWVFSYPSGYPYMHSAAILRQNLDAIEKRFPMKKKMVVIGHSMGGCISRLLITDVGDKIWMSYFGKPPEQTEMSPQTKKLLSDALIFNHRPEIGRVIFIAAPLKGADKAGGKLGQLGAKLVKAPFALLQAGNEILEQVTDTPDAKTLKRMPNSVDTLSPNNRFVKTINTYPLSTTIPYHAIVGDRGKGGSKDHTKPVSSDGLVPYWSSYLPNAKSELIVPTNHGAHQNPQAIAEVERILLLHAKGSTAR